MPSNWSSNKRTRTTSRGTRSAWSGKSTGASKARGGKTGSTARSTSRTTASKTSKTRSTTKCAPGYSSVFNSLNQKIQNMRTLCNQATGPAKVKRPTPTTINTFTNWINKGCNVATVSNAQIKKWASASNKTFKAGSPTSAKTILCTKFGKSTIKAVACGKNGGFIVASAPNWKGKPFNVTKAR